MEPQNPERSGGLSYFWSLTALRKLMGSPSASLSNLRDDEWSAADAVDIALTGDGATTTATGVVVDVPMRRSTAPLTSRSPERER